jgi:hypothetical protein
MCHLVTSYHGLDLWRHLWKRGVEDNFGEGATDADEVVALLELLVRDGEGEVLVDLTFAIPRKTVLAGGYDQGVALVRGGLHAHFAPPGGVHHGVLDGFIVQGYVLDRGARGGKTGPLPQPAFASGYAATDTSPRTWRARVCYKGGRTLEGVHTNVYDASAAGAVRPRGADGHRSGGGRLRGALPQVRDRRSGAGDLRRSAAGAVGAGAA